MKQKITSWGMYPWVDANVLTPTLSSDIHRAMQLRSLIPRGNGRSYGDSALGENILSSSYCDHLIELNTTNHTLKVQAGVTMDQLIQFLVPRGYFLPVVPGTKYVSIGGAVASDIHGKNHHKEGTFTDHVIRIKLMSGNGEWLECSRDHNVDLFQATCGGMGLTGFIHEVEFSLKPIRSNRIDQITHKAANIDELFDLFELYEEKTYSVAWIDCVSTGSKLGRSLMMVGEHETETSSLNYKDVQIPIAVPNMPNWVLNPLFVSAFNTLYYHRKFTKVSGQKITLDPFFFPLDKLKHWNRLYGTSGFTQYQFVVPKQNGKEAIKKVLVEVAREGTASFLAVLKLFGKENGNFLSFPMEGYTLTLDFKITDTLFPFLHRLNEMIMEYGGRVYLTKDVCLPQKHFEQMYGKQIELFQTTRVKYHGMNFQSLQSRRLGL